MAKVTYNFCFYAKCFAKQVMTMAIDIRFKKLLHMPKPILSSSIKLVLAIKDVLILAD